MKYPSIGVPALTMILLLAGCAGTDQNPARETSSEPESVQPSEKPEEPISDEPEEPISGEPSEAPSEEVSEPEAADASKDDLLIMEVPESCMDLGGKRLIDGKLVWKPTGAKAQINPSQFEPFAIDADGDGAVELIAPFYCDGGGVPWPDQIVLVDAGGALLDSTDVVAAFGGDGGYTRGRIEGWSVAEKHVDAAVALSAGGIEGGSLAEGTVSAAAGKLVFKLGEPAPSPAPESSSQPPNASGDFDGALLSTMGYGPMGFGLSGQELLDRGWGVILPDDFCEAVRPSKELEAQGIWYSVEGGAEGELWTIWAETSHAKTPSGARVGISLDQLRQLYGAALKEGNEYLNWYVEADGHTLVFNVEGGAITEIQAWAAPWSTVKEPKGFC